MKTLDHEVIALDQRFIGNEQVLQEVPDAAMTWMLFYFPHGEMCMSKGKGGNPSPKEDMKTRKCIFPLVLGTFTFHKKRDQRICTSAD